jgi:hypothetical protein
MKRAIIAEMAALGGGRTFHIKTLFDLIAAESTNIENATIIAPLSDVVVGPDQKIVPALGQIEVN